LEAGLEPVLAVTDEINITDKYKKVLLIDSILPFPNHAKKWIRHPAVTHLDLLMRLTFMSEYRVCFSLGETISFSTWSGTTKKVYGLPNWSCSCNIRSLEC